MNLKNNSNAMRYGQRGFTLIELMISIVIGLIILSAVLGLFVSLIKSDSDNIKAIQLNHELRTAMSLMTRDLRRAGYNGASAANVIAGTANPFQELAFNILAPPILNATCVTYAYDADNDGINDGNSERFGFRLNSGAIETRESGEACSSTTNWDNITDENLVEITSFNVSDPDLIGDEPEETALPGKTSAGITIHRITITLAGRLVRDPTVSRSITEFVEIRNDEY